MSSSFCHIIGKITGNLSFSSLSGKDDTTYSLGTEVFIVMLKVYLPIYISFNVLTHMGVEFCQIYFSSMGMLQNFSTLFC